MSGLDAIKDSMNGLELLKISEEQFPWLVDNLIPKYGVGALVGESETGKSTFLRQLSLSISRGEKKFLGFNLEAKHKKAIYVSTEDEQVATAHWLGAHLEYHKTDNRNKKNYAFLKNLTFLFEHDNLVKKLKEKLEGGNVDLIVIDAFSDIFLQEINATNAVRTFINSFMEIAKSYHCFVLFLHHYGKSRKGSDKNRVLGSQGFEGKMRVLLSLEKGDNNFDLRIIKHNYLSNEAKAVSYELSLNSNLKFIKNGEKDIKATTNKKKKRTKKERLKEDYIDLLRKYRNKEMTAEKVREEIINRDGEDNSISVGLISSVKIELYGNDEI